MRKSKNQEHTFFFKLIKIERMFLEMQNFTFSGLLRLLRFWNIFLPSFKRNSFTAVFQTFLSLKQIEKHPYERDCNHLVSNNLHTLLERFKRYFLSISIVFLTLYLRFKFVFTHSFYVEVSCKCTLFKVAVDHIFFPASIGVIRGGVGKKMTTLAPCSRRAMLQSQVLKKFPPDFSLFWPSFDTF